MGPLNQLLSLLTMEWEKLSPPAYIAHREWSLSVRCARISGGTLFPTRTTFCGISWLTLMVIATSSLAQGAHENDMLRHMAMMPQSQSNASAARRPLRINPNFPQVPSAAASLPKGAIHLMVRSDADARQIFTYFPCPRVAARPGAVGVYRLEVNSQGTVVAVTILKSMGPRRDVRVMQTFVG